ncbi:hypothetical protein [uncultured Jannaschia sp.]|uniref:hypothetical protein n=1 Tax=uncultured Jannaschia sp. TaxID=293347 RepID=UPI002639C6A7|nr:hypothetical protein [uncultured Jannaschia sp.]
MKGTWVPLALSLTACQASLAPDPPERGLLLVPGPNGLDVVGSGGLEIGFGRDRSGVLESVARVEGRESRPAACGSGREAYATRGGLRLVFEGDTFVGWEGPQGAAGRGCG